MIILNSIYLLWYSNNVMLPSVSSEGHNMAVFGNTHMLEQSLRLKDIGDRAVRSISERNSSAFPKKM